MISSLPLCAISFILVSTTVFGAECGSYTIQWINCSTVVPYELLPSTLHCGQLTVPMNYEEPIGDMNNVTLHFAMYRPQNPKGLINFNPGGPNGEVPSNIWELALNTSTAEPLLPLIEYDILGESTFCSPTTEGEFQLLQEAANQYATSCNDQSKPGLIETMSTNVNIQDWNSVRQALGYDEMNFLAESYGTFGAARYAAKYPQHIGRMVLDAVLATGLPNVKLLEWEVESVNNLLLRSDAYCLNDTACPYRKEGKGSIVKAYQEAVAMADGGNSSGVSSSDFRAMAYLNFLDTRPKFPALNQALYDAIHQGNWSAFNYTAYAPYYTPQLMAVLPTVCLDQDLQNHTFAYFESIQADLNAVDRFDMKYVQDLTLVPLCAGWPFKGQPNRKVYSEAAMLLVTADFDLNTPANSTFYERLQLPNTTLVVRHGDDHVSDVEPGPVRNIESEYLASGVLPSATNGTLYTVYPPGCKPGPILNPYDVPVGTVAGDIE
ncbi:hypothetical protein BD324DRAFT_664686 [Kockovaella imperatae]|uniref:AB hydrolase-1 domain-containing protein n=1 Tax=Kockovaella imperatae TaxID=4999 RepID=A0A1Y1U9K7_9TREE|nr:hypothetical protein BD324DRAFT_664686 [Kockovaella imperatae]ORX34187.1 hypothetical protein BD324DRAFT_664686 [Kockovaella imperatae]